MKNREFRKQRVRDPKAEAAICCFWQRTRQSAGQIIGIFHPQLPGAAEGERGACPPMELTQDTSDGTWTVTGLGQTITGTGSLSDPYNAYLQLRLAAET